MADERIEAGTLFGFSSKSNDQDFDNRHYTFMTVRVELSDGAVCNAKFFQGRMPAVGEAVDMVYVGDLDDGSMRFMLRARDPKPPALWCPVCGDGDHDAAGHDKMVAKAIDRLVANLEADAIGRSGSDSALD